MPPVTQKLIAGIAVFVVILGGIGYGIYAKSDENSAVEGQIQKLNDEIAELQKTIDKKEEMKKHRAAQDEIFKELVTVLPAYSERQDERVMETLTAYASVCKLTPKGLVPKVNAPVAAAPGAPPGPGGPQAQGGKDFAQTELRINYEGTFFNFLKFLNMVENNDSFLRVDEILLSPTVLGATEVQPEHRLLQITVKISTFHYVAK
jgi:hypothetical protein